MTDQEKRDQQLNERLRACAEHSWDSRNKDGVLKHRPQFEAMGIRSPEELHKVLETATRDKQTRSFDRTPEPALKQTEPSMILQAKVQDKQGKDHQLTIILNPNKDDQGKPYGGTAYVNDPNRRTDISRLLRIEHKKGNDPAVLMRGQGLTRSAANSVKSPVSRLGEATNKPPRQRPTPRLGGKDRGHER